MLMSHRTVPWILLAGLFFASNAATGCAGEATVCEATERYACDQCYGNVYTCSYDGVSLTTRACEGCQARLDLYRELCAQGRTETRAEVDEGMVCEIADTGAL
jgi:hypothetical protein